MKLDINDLPTILCVVVGCLITLIVIIILGMTHRYLTFKRQRDIPEAAERIFQEICDAYDELQLEICSDYMDQENGPFEEYIREAPQGGMEIYWEIRIRPSKDNSTPNAVIMKTDANKSYPGSRQIETALRAKLGREFMGRNKIIKILS